MTMGWVLIGSGLILEVNATVTVVDRGGDNNGLGTGGNAIELESEREVSGHEG